jgi:hypothetical protein
MKKTGAIAEQILTMHHHPPGVPLQQRSKDVRLNPCQRNTHEKQQPRRRHLQHRITWGGHPADCRCLGQQ